MCIQPVKIPNPYFTQQGYEYREGDILPLDSRFVSHKEYIDVPCGKCADCKNTYLQSLLQRVQMEALTSYVFFVTLTYDDAHIPHITFTGREGTFFRKYDIYYSDRHHIQLLMKRLRDDPYMSKRQFRYLAVTEYGTARFRPHHHLLLFVGKRKNDPDYTPYHMERQLWHLIKNKYGVNVGTRKNPVYQPLFTYATKVVNGKRMSNYDCVLVRDTSKPYGSLDSVNDVPSIQKSALYLMSYLNKPSVYDELLLPFLDGLRSALPGTLYSRLLSQLKCQCYYSKHLGFGYYEDGMKVKPSCRSMSVTDSRLYLHDTVMSFPSTYEEFSSMYPHLHQKVELYANKLLDYHINFLHNSNISNFLDKQEPEENLLFLLVRKYMPGVIRSFILSNHLVQQDYYPSLLPLTDYNDDYKTSATYKYIRRSIENGLNNKVPYLSFEYVYKGKLSYTPLSKYFKRYCTTFEDISRLYDSLGVSNFDVYLSLFEQNIQSYIHRLEAQKTNKDMHERKNIEKGNYVLKSKNNGLWLQNKKLIHIFVPTFKSLEALII